MRTERYKLVFDTLTGSFALFDLDLDIDPGEYRDVAPEHPDVARDLMDLLSRRLAWEEERFALSPETAPVPEELQKRLKSLGYLSR